jgi:hypothetical protein
VGFETSRGGDGAELKRSQQLEVGFERDGNFVGGGGASASGGSVLVDSSA